jgi:hypothetical protein
MARQRRRQGFWYRHSLSIVTGAFLILWICLYTRSSPRTHVGSFFGNAIADWSGALLTISEWMQVFLLVLMTKRLIERHSKESNR